MFKKMNMKDLASKIDESYYPVIMSYIYILTILCRLFEYTNDNKKDDDKLKSMFETSMIIVNKIEKNTEYEKDLSLIHDDKMVKLFKALEMLYEKAFTNNYENDENEKHETENGENEDQSNEPPTDDFMKNIQNTLKGTKMGKFADDIVQELSQDLQDDVGEITDFQSFMQSGKIGKVINKTLEHFQKKNSSGELSQEDVLKDCVNLMGLFGNPNFGGNQTNTQNTQNANNSGAGPSMPPFNMNDMQKVMSLFSGEDKFKLDPVKMNQEKNKAQVRDRLRKKINK